MRPLGAVEFRHESWFRGDNEQETLDHLRRHGIAYVCRHAVGTGPRCHRCSPPLPIWRWSAFTSHSDSDQPQHLRAVRLSLHRERAACGPRLRTWPSRRPAPMRSSTTATAIAQRNAAQLEFVVARLSIRYVM